MAPNPRPQVLELVAVTSALHGLVRDDPGTRQEFLALMKRIDA